MSTQVEPDLRRTPLYDRHVAAGGRMVPFAGWEMPVQYDGVMAEHHAVRTSAGLFDVSHMGQLVVEGPSASLDLQRLLSNDITRLAEDGHAQYTLLTNEAGGIEDDLIVYRTGVDSFLLVVNAANTAHDHELVANGVHAETTVTNRSADFGMLALQGPRALDVLADRLVDVRDLRPFRFRTVRVDGAPVTVATTGYTGEPGCEIMASPETIVSIWDMLLGDDRVRPAGLGARDTLRLEVCYPLHGNDIDATTTAVSAGLSWVCAFSTDFTGCAALRAERDAGPASRLVAITMVDRGIPRGGCTLHADGRRVGHVTSGTMSPTLARGIALGYVDSDLANPGVELEVEVRGKRYSALVTEKPFYRKERTA